MIAHLRKFLHRRLVVRASLYWHRHVYGMDIGDHTRISRGARLDRTNPKGIHIGMALAMALGLTLFIETAQLTALFGLYPCPYRQFDVDDLILNVAGILAGFALARGMTGMAGTPR